VSLRIDETVAAAMVVVCAAGCGLVKLPQDAGGDLAAETPAHDTRLESDLAPNPDLRSEPDARPDVDVRPDDGPPADIRGPDVPPADGRPPDVPPRRCNPAAPFQPPVALASVNTPDSEESACLSPDELTLYFSSTRTGTLGGYDMFMATRTRADLGFGNITPLANLNTAAHERRPIVTGDGLTLYALLGTSPNYEIGASRRASTDVAFAPLAVLAGINSTSNDEPSSVLPDHRALYFHSTRGGNYDIYRAPRAGSQFAAAAPVSGVMLNMASSDHSAVTTTDELTLFFSSDRAGGIGGNDLYVATRTSTADGFGVPANLQIVNTTSNESPSWVSADGCVLYFTRGPTGAYDIYTTTRGM
jgi:hypothetical protein